MVIYLDNNKEVFMDNYKEFYEQLKQFHKDAVRMPKKYRVLADKTFDEFAALLCADGIIE